MDYIPYSQQQIDQEDISAVAAVLQSDFLTQGPNVTLFEKLIAKHVYAEYSVATSSATAALHVACLAFGVNQNSLVWTVPNTFVASANCALYCGAKVDFVDIDFNTGNLSVECLENKLVEAESNGALPDLLIPVHFSGQPTDQSEIWHLSQKYGFKVLEDCSHSLGARCGGSYAGSCKFSHAAIFSFHPVKMITCAEGGMITTNDAEIYQKSKMFSSHGITRERARLLADNKPDWYYEQHILGYNYRMNDIQAALGVSQLAKLDHFVAQRNTIAKKYDDFFLNTKYVPLKIDDAKYCSYHLYVVRVGKSRDEIFNFLRSKNVGVNVHYQPVHLQPYYRKLGFALGMYPSAERHGVESISIPIFPSLSEVHQNKVIELFSNLMK